MPNPRLASRYAKSLIDLATETGKLEEVFSDMKRVVAICKSNRDLVSFLRSPIIKADKKNAILTTITEGRVDNLTREFIKLLVNKGRESDLPEIAESVVEQYNSIKGIHHVKLTTATEVSDAVKNSVIAKINAEAGLENVELETVVDSSLIGGFILDFNNNRVDASVSRDLNDIKKQFSQNVFVSHLK